MNRLNILVAISLVAAALLFTGSGRATAIQPSSAPATAAPSPPTTRAAELRSNWEQSIVKSIAAGAFSMVSFSFAGFTFLFGALLSLKGEDARADNLRTALRGALYFVAGAVLFAALVAALALISSALDLPVLGYVSIWIALVVLVTLPAVALFLSFYVYQEGKLR